MNSNDEAMASEIFGDLVYAYSRADAIRDGVLIDVSERAKRAGIRYPTACTTAVWALIDCLPDSETDTLAGIVADARLAAVLRGMLAAIRRGGARGTDRVEFGALGCLLWAQCGPGDTGEPVITIMREGED